MEKTEYSPYKIVHFPELIQQMKDEGMNLDKDKFIYLPNYYPTKNFKISRFAMRSRLINTWPF